MKKRANIVLLLLLLIGSFLCGAWYNGQGTGGSKSKREERKVLYYVDPMNPSHTSDKPGTAPCGMAMEPIHAEDEAGGAGNPPRFVPPGTARITPERQQMFGIRVDEVEVRSQSHALRTLGRVAADENRTYSLVAATDGWVWGVHESTTGSLVRKDQLMATVYNYQFLARQQQYLYAVDFAQRNMERLAKRSGPSKPGEQVDIGAIPFDHTNMAVPTAPSGLNPTGNVYYVEDQVGLAKLELYNLGVGDYQVNALAREKKISTELELRSPVNGLVLARNITTMQRFDKGAELYRIADLSRVWIQADVFENEARYVPPGTKARVTLPDDGRVFHAEVTDVPPQFDPATRSLKVRLEAENPGFELRPDMFVDVELIVFLPPSLTVPVDAVLDAGLRKTVFVDQGDGYFEPRRVETGWRLGDRVEILEGLMPGEKIVTSGNFLIDSESRMKLAAAGLFGAPHKDPVCGMEVYAGKAKAEGLTVEHEGKTSYFCSEECRQAFLQGRGHQGEKAPETGEGHGAHGAKHPKSIQVSKDPVCGMLIHEKDASASGLTHEFNGKTFFFCSPECKKLFETYPDRYAERAARMEALRQSAGSGEKAGPGTLGLPPTGMGDEVPTIPTPPKTGMGGRLQSAPPAPRTLPEVRNDEAAKGVSLSGHQHGGASRPTVMVPPSLEVQTYGAGAGAGSTVEPGDYEDE
jgi:multidrug efflux pump subunit AcrA (membrane-fusion protein)/YHS domain-containing protein